MPVEIECIAHPRVDAQWFDLELSRDVGAMSTPDEVLDWLSHVPSGHDEGTHRAPWVLPPEIDPSQSVTKEVRDMLRLNGYKPKGRGKPASEYLAKAVAEGGLRSINALVDVCNAASLWSGFPISVLDAAKLQAPLRIDVCRADEEVVFNPSGQSIKVAGLPCLFDSVGPCANAVKDAQRTKTSGETQAVVVVVWGLVSEPARTLAARNWCRAMISAL